MLHMIRKSAGALLAMVAAATSVAQPANNAAAVAKFQHYFNAQQPDSVYSLLSAHVQGTMTEDKSRQMFKQMYTTLGPLNHYEFSKQNGQISIYKAVFAQKTLSLAMSVDSNNKIENFRFLPYQVDTVKSNITLTTSSGNIYGTLTVPPGNTKVPVVLIIAGSGPTDRNCNQPGMRTDAYKMLADSLNKYGIASVRYDKRGSGESMAAMGKEEDLNFDDIISDAAGFIRMLKADSRFSKVIVLGHSEGSLVGMIAAARENTDGFISLAGAGERADKIIVKQVSAQSPALAKTARAEFDSVLKGYTVVAHDQVLTSVLRPSVEPYLRSWFQYDPATEINKLKQPVLLLQGTNDLQVSVQDAESLKKAHRSAELQLIEGMNHVLKIAPADRQQNFATYRDPSLPLADRLVTAITTFVNR